MSETIPTFIACREIRKTDGPWASVWTKLLGRELCQDDICQDDICYYVEYEDGQREYWPVDNKEAGYEFR